GADAWADVIAATPLAAQLNANILYTGSDALNSRTKAELERLHGLTNTRVTTGWWKRPGTVRVTNVIIIGGTGAVSDAVRAEIEGMADNAGNAHFTVQRIGGGDRYETALLVAAETVDYYEGGGSAIAGARKNLEENTANLNAVANAN